MTDIIKEYKLIEREIDRYRRDPDEIIDPVIMATDNNVRTVFADFSGYPKLENKLGYYRIDVDDQGNLQHTVCRRKDIEPRWLSFTLAHELAHYFYHKNVEKEWPNPPLIVDAFSKETSNNEIEQICDMFARELLMPSNRFINGVSYYRGIFTDLSDKTAAEYLANDFYVPYSHSYTRGVELGKFKNG